MGVTDLTPLHIPPLKLEEPSQGQINENMPELWLNTLQTCAGKKQAGLSYNCVARPFQRTDSWTEVTFIDS